MMLNIISLLAGSKIKLVIAAIVIGAVTSVALGGWLYVRNMKNTIAELRDENSNLKAENSIHKDNNAVLRENVRTLATANFSNWQTAKALIDERSKAQDSINRLAAATLRDKQALDRLSQRIEEMLKDPANDGPVAPVLREIVREIQKERDKL